MKNVMIDLETLGVSPGCCILSIGAIKFCPDIGKVDLRENAFYKVLDWRDQEFEGFTIESDIWNWWDKQLKDAKMSLLGRDDLKMTIENFCEFLPENPIVWGNGSSFDISILEYVYRYYKIEIPWKFWNIRDCRTLKALYESRRGGLSLKMSGTKHLAIDDAISQSKQICKIWNKV